MNAMIVFEPRAQAVLEAFEEALEYQNLIYSASSLNRYGFRSETEIGQAIARAMRVCKCLGIDIKKHFRYFYQVDISTRETTRAWKVSKLGYYLVLCNGEPGNPFVSAFQVDMIRELLHKLD